MDLVRGPWRGAGDMLGGCSCKRKHKQSLCGGDGSNPPALPSKPPGFYLSELPLKPLLKRPGKVLIPQPYFVFCFPLVHLFVVLLLFVEKLNHAQL